MSQKVIHLETVARDLLDVVQENSQLWHLRAQVCAALDLCPREPRFCSFGSGSQMETETLDKWEANARTVRDDQILNVIRTLRNEGESTP